MKTRLITLRNRFHNRQTRVRIPANADPVNWQTEISWATLRRVHRALCGNSDCSCAGMIDVIAD